MQNVVPGKRDSKRPQRYGSCEIDDSKFEPARCLLDIEQDQALSSYEIGRGI